MIILIFSFIFALDINDYLLIGDFIMNTLLFLGNLGTPEIIIIAIVVLLLFGGKKIPELMKGLGKGINQFKRGMKEVEDEIKIDDTPSTN